jgi:hypothetical protein
MISLSRNITLLALAAAGLSPTPLLASSGSRPNLEFTVGNGSNTIEVPAGSSLSVSSTVSDPDGDLVDHWLEIQNPNGSWSWDGWLTSEPWLGGLMGSTRQSVKTTAFAFTTPGTYHLRSSASDSQMTGDWIVSETVTVNVVPAPTLSTATPPRPTGARPAVVTNVNGDVGNLQLPLGATVSIVSSAVDTTGDMQEHWLEIQGPEGLWSWEGWLTTAPWNGELGGNGSASNKGTTFTFTKPGVYYIRATAVDAVASHEWILSNTVQVLVQAAPYIPSTPTDPAPLDPAASLPPIHNADGTINRAAYLEHLADWTRQSVSRHLGPTFEELNPNAVDDRPLNFKPTSRSCPTSYVNKWDPFELGTAQGCYDDDDYWSEAGQVAYVPDDLANDPGLDRVQTFAYYNNVFALSPRLDWTGVPHPDPQTQEQNYKDMLGRAPKHPVAMVRNYAQLSNEAIVIYRGGLVAVAGTQTSREGSERPYPGFVFPAHKVPTSIALTAGNELALITIWDTQALRGQLAVVALEAKYLPYHTWQYMGLPNQGSWSDMKLLGYVDLPMATPNAVAASSNAWWNGPSQTAGKVLSEIDLTDGNIRWGIVNSEPQWQSLVADRGYAVVSSRHDNKAVIVDLTPVFSYIRSSYFGSNENFWETVSNRGAGPGKWPLTFTERPSSLPRVVWEKTVPGASAVLAGLHIDRWSPDRHKAYIAREDGTIHILDTSSLMARFDWEKRGALTEIGSLKVGRNPVSMAFTRHLDYPLSALPVGHDGQFTRADPLNNTFYVACRGDREVVAVVTYEGQGSVYRRIRDKRMGDPVGVSVTGRGNIVSVTDFNGRKLMSFRVGAIWDRYGRYYGPGADGKADYEFAGELYFNGYPFAVNTANVN